MENLVVWSDITERLEIAPEEVVMKTIALPPLTEEQQALAQRIRQRIQERLSDEWQTLSELLACRQFSQLLGQTEFDVRDIVHKMGALALETALTERKKGDTPAAATPAPTVRKRPSSSVGRAKPM